MGLPERHRQLGMPRDGIWEICATADFPDSIPGRVEQDPTLAQQAEDLRDRRREIEVLVVPHARIPRRALQIGLLRNRSGTPQEVVAQRDECGVGDVVRRGDVGAQRVRVVLELLVQS